jgi:hypothetical protein
MKRKRDRPVTGQRRHVRHRNGSLPQLCNTLCGRGGRAAAESEQTATVTVTVRDELGGREGQGVWRDTRPESADMAVWDALPAKNGGSNGPAPCTRQSNRQPPYHSLFETDICAVTQARGNGAAGMKVEG